MTILATSKRLAMAKSGRDVRCYRAVREQFDFLKTNLHTTSYEVLCLFL